MRLLVLLTVLAALAAAPAAHAAPAVFFVDGRGWGHGIGMPQYGANGYALEEGRKHPWILAHYYQGTTLGDAPVATVRVLLASNRPKITISSAGPFTATDAKNRTFAFPAQPLVLGPGLKITVNGRERTLASPVTFKPGTRNLRYGKAYRGQLIVRSANGRMSLVNRVGLEKYLYGVVPDEMPPSWHPEALKAQAVAARSYAIVSRKTGQIFDLYPDTRSQVYNGVSAEDARATAAIDATAGKVVMYDGAVAWTFFHSTSGGKTAAIQHVWSGGAPQPYLVSVPDPYDKLSPYHRWGPFRYGAAALKAALASYAPAGALVDARVTRNGSSRVASVTLQGSGGTSSVAGTGVQARLGLRSSWFSIGVLRLWGKGATSAGSPVTLNGLARGFPKVRLERRIGSGQWQLVREITPKDGRLTVTVRPRRTTAFRLVTGRGASPAHLVGVRTTASLRASALGDMIR
jgi:stage II sporulation protein D